jgi:nucleoside-diphosphate-sugar epimerase
MKMKILITGAAGNLGSFLARHMASGRHELNLLAHRKAVAPDVARRANVHVFRGDLARTETLAEPLSGVDAVVHLAGVLFKPQPEKFLPRTNFGYARNLVDAALAAGVGKIILVSFPHVEGESSPARPARGTLNGKPTSMHARTRLAAELYLFDSCTGTPTTPVVLRPGMIYGAGVLMVEAAKRLLRRHLLAVWRRPTWVHLVSLPDFLTAVTAAIEKTGIAGIYNIGDDDEVTLQEFLDTVADHCGSPRPARLPHPLFYAAATAVELYGAIFGTRAPLTRDFIKIGTASYYGDTSRMKADLVPELRYPTLRRGLALL